MQVGEVKTEVTVTGQGHPRSDNANVSSDLTGQQIDQLPVDSAALLVS